MGYRIWTAKIGGRSIEFKMAKEDAKRAAQQIQDAGHARQTWRELSGVIGVSERSHGLYAPLGGGRGVVADGYDAALAEFWASLPALITDENRVETVKRAGDFLGKWTPTVDDRLTPEQDAERAARSHAIQAAHEDKRHAEQSAAIAEWGEPGAARVALPGGMMAVTINQTYDDSDCMTDYYHPHASCSPTFLLAIVPEQARTERLARAIVARYPQLAEVSFTWHTENYSGGHGNYLMSDVQGRLPETVKTYGHVSGPSWSWEVEFDGWTKAPYPVFKGYPGTVAQPTSGNTGAANGESHAGNGGGTVRRNLEHDGIEVVFPAKPAADILAGLRGLGFRWSPRQSLWYARYSTSLEQSARGLVGA